MPVERARHRCQCPDDAGVSIPCPCRRERWWQFGWRCRASRALPTQSGQTALPAVTIDAPEAQARRAARKPDAVRRRADGRPADDPALRTATSCGRDHHRGGGSAASCPGTPPIKRGYQLPQTVRERHGRRTSRRRSTSSSTPDAVKYMPSLFVRKRNTGDTQPVLGDPYLGRRGQRPQPCLCRRHPAVSALIANNNTDRRAALGAGRAGRDRAGRISVRPVFGGLSRQFDGRRSADHDADAGQARDHGQADRSVPDIRFLPDEKYLPHRPEQRLDRR